MRRKYEDLTGKQFGRWIVLSEAEPQYKIESNGHKHLRRFWNCECTCENKTQRIVSGASLRNGNSTSCGCLRIENAIPVMNKANKQNNTFNIIDDKYAEIIDASGNVGLIDINDIEKVKKYYWYKTTLSKNNNQENYMYTHILENGKDHKLSLHEYLTNQKYVDHINHNGLDNRRCNLRIPSELFDNLITSNQGYNNINHKLGKNNTSGYKGVVYNKTNGKWIAQIGMNYKTIHLGTFNTKEEAIEARKIGEEKYYPNWNLNKSTQIAIENAI